MSYFLRKTLPFGFSSVSILPTTSYVGFVGNPDVFSLRWFSSGSNQQSFVVSYLINELGLSAQSALKVLSILVLRLPRNQTNLLSCLRSLVSLRPKSQALSENTLKCFYWILRKFFCPSWSFFEAKGVSWPLFAKRLSSFPVVLGSSLAKQIRPLYEFFRNFLQSDEKAIATVERCPHILVANIGKYVAPNISILRENGVPDSNIAKLIPWQPRAFTSTSDWFRKIVEEVVSFGQAVIARYGLSKSMWENKVNVFKKLDWSEEEVLEAFERHPMCMMLSEDKIMSGMDFFVGKMGLSPCLIAYQPVLLTMSLKKRLIPRSAVFQVLLSRGLVKKEVNLLTFFQTSEKKFLQKFVTPYEEEAPELLKLYKERFINLSNGPLVEKA